MFINEKLQIEEYNYPLYRKNNPIFRSIIENEEKVDHSNCKSKMTKWDLHFKHKEISDFINWVIDITEDSMIRPYNGYFSLMCVNSWGLICNKGNYVEEHRHERSSFSFVYYINSPKGSSPLVFTTSGHEVKPQEGKLVVFNSALLHCVPINKCDARYSLIGVLSDKRE